MRCSYITKAMTSSKPSIWVKGSVFGALNVMNIDAGF